MVYCVTFLSEKGLKESVWNNKWIMGKVINQLITHKNKNKRYVHDETALQSSLGAESFVEEKLQSETSMM
jgi:hypothetical protein